MFDRQATRWIRPAVDGMARRLHAVGVGADALSFTGFAVGVLAAVLVASGFFGWALGAIVLSRLIDGLDGAVARLTMPTDRGGFLDITLDFLFYASIPFAFAVADPARRLDRGRRNAGLLHRDVPLATTLCLAGLELLRAVRSDDRDAHLLGLAGLQVSELGEEVVEDRIALYRMALPHPRTPGRSIPCVAFGLGRAIAFLAAVTLQLATDCRWCSAEAYSD